MAESPTGRWTIGPAPTIRQVPKRNFPVRESLQDLDFVRAIQVKRRATWKAKDPA